MTLPTTHDALSLAICRLKLARSLRRGEAPALRGFFGRQFEDQVLVHNHGPNNELIYQYPRVQFKVIDQTAHLIGVGPGAELLQQLWLDIDRTKLGNEDLPVLEADLQATTFPITVSEDWVHYRFESPWLALNQKNHREYSQMRSSMLRQEKLSKTLIGNCLSMCKSLGIYFQSQIKADASELASIKTSLKGKEMLGFVGRFRLNVQLPSYLGLGKSVSRGFGTIQRRNPC